MNDAKLTQIDLYRIRLPLHTTYRLSYHTFDAFEPIIVIIHDSEGNSGFGEGHISPGSSSETRAGGWAFCNNICSNIISHSLADSISTISTVKQNSPVAATALITALEMLDKHPLLNIEKEYLLPLLTPFNATSPDTIIAEVEQRLAQGFRTFKIKVGTDVEADLIRVNTIQSVVNGRAILRIDANRGYTQEQGCRFAAALNPEGIALFEQPCATENWNANAAVARVSTVPLMLDEPICSLADIERAGTIEGVAYCKVKLKRFGGLALLQQAIQHIQDSGIQAVLGDGLASEPMCWMEACIASKMINNAGEFNGFLKPSVRLFEQPLQFSAGHLTLSTETPKLNQQMLNDLKLDAKHYYG